MQAPLLFPLHGSTHFSGHCQAKVHLTAIRKIGNDPQKFFVHKNQSSKDADKEVKKHIVSTHL